MKQYRSIFIQISAVILSSSGCALLAARWGYQSPFNAIWMFAFPALIAIIFNKERMHQAGMLIVLTFFSYLSTILVGVYYGHPY